MYERFLQGVSLLGIAFLAFTTGLVLAYFKLPPTNILHEAVNTIKELKRNPSQLTGVPVDHLKQLRPGIVDTEVSNDGRAMPGVVFLAGLFEDRLGFRLVNNANEVIHEWPIDFFTIAPETMTSRFHALVHGAWLYENGDILANLDQRRLYRVGACGDTVWQNEDHSHHSIHVDAEGFIWTPTKRIAYNEPRILPGEVFVDRLAKFDPGTGKKLLEIDLVETLIQADMQGIAIQRKNRRDDLLHLNDVEVLSSAIADAFPQFDAGDLVLSLRDINQIWVLDGDTHWVKWWQAGPWYGQHDPDFQADGTITLFDNRTSTRPSAANNFLGDMGGSRISKLDPVTGVTTTLFESSNKLQFHSPYRGKHQVLANGNILITETDAGRAFEVTPSGDMVWSFINRYNDEKVGWIMGAYKFPESYADFAAKPC